MIKQQISRPHGREETLIPSIHRAQAKGLTQTDRGETMDWNGEAVVRWGVGEEAWTYVQAACERCKMDGTRATRGVGTTMHSLGSSLQIHHPEAIPVFKSPALQSSGIATINKSRAESSKAG